MKFKAVTILAILSIIIAGCQKEDNPETPIAYFNVDFNQYSCPSNGAENVSFQIKPYLAFNKRLNYEYYKVENCIYYKIIYDSSYISDDMNNKLEAVTSFNERKDTLFFSLNSGFLSNTNYNIKFFYHIEVRRSNDNDSYEILQKDGSPFIGEFESAFKVMNYNYNITTANVKYAYPWPYQYHFLKDETNKGILILKDNQEYDQYFKNASFKVRFYSATSLIDESIATYDANKRKYSFLIPTNKLENKAIYKVEFIMVDNQNESETTFFSYHFRTSKYNSFKEKINTIANIAYYSIYVSQSATALSLKFDISESFDQAEGQPYTGLIQFDASIDSLNPWIKNVINWFYDGLENSQFELSRSNTPIDIPPTNNVVILSQILTPLLNETQILNNSAPDYDPGVQWIDYNIDVTYTNDYCEILNKVNSTSNLNTWERELKDGTHFTNLYINQTYKAAFNYIVDGNVTSSDTLNWEF